MTKIEELLDGKMCKYKYYQKGSRSYGDYLPGYAQGAYFPGDEPGNCCNLDDGPCYTEYHEMQHDLCPLQEDTGIACPDCGRMMLKNGACVVYCPECGYLQ